MLTVRSCLATRKWMLLATFTLLPLSPLRGDEPSAVVFSAMADIPYNEREAALLPRQIAELDPRSAFAVHLGDITGVGGACDESIYSWMAGVLAEAAMPVFFLPGDNEWNDCEDPAAAWELWTKHLLRFEDRWTHDLEVSRQRDRPENFAFVRGDVLFLGVNLVGGRVHDASEWRRRHQQDLAWMRRNLKGAGKRAKSMVILTHAHPLGPHADYLGGLIREAERFDRPILILHGDGHVWLLDRPSRAGNLLRVQLDAGGASPVTVTVTDNEAEPFHFDRHLPRGADRQGQGNP